MSDSVKQRIRNSRRALHELGFRRVEKYEGIQSSLQGKVVALNIGTVGHHLTMYRVKKVNHTGVGYIVEQGEDNRTMFYYVDFEEGRPRFTGTQQHDLELYIPHYLNNRRAFFIGEEMPELEETVEQLGFQEFKPKRYLTRKEIIEQDPKLYEEILKHIEENSLDPEELEKWRQFLKERHKRDKVIDIETRVKTPESVYAWIQRNPSLRSVNDIGDINGIRITAETAGHCLYLMRCIYDYSVDDVRDLITFPKPNGFQGIIIKKSSEDYSNLEIQLQTPQMKARAERDNYRENQPR